VSSAATSSSESAPVEGWHRRSRGSPCSRDRPRAFQHHPDQAGGLLLLNNRNSGQTGKQSHDPLAFRAVAGGALVIVDQAKRKASKINTAINQRDEMTRQNAAIAGRRRGRVDRRPRKARDLSGLVGRFDVAGQARGEVEAARPAFLATDAHGEGALATVPVRARTGGAGILPCTGGDAA
jgi:hypothetical protein